MASEEAVFFAQRLWNERFHLMPEKLRGFITEHPIQRGVGHLDAALVVDQQDPVGTALYNRFEQEFIALQFPGPVLDDVLEMLSIFLDRLFILLALRDVAFDRHEIGQVARLVEERLDLDRKPEFFAIATVVDQFRREAAPGAQFLRHELNGFGVGLGPLQEFAGLSSYDLFQPPAGCAREGVVHPFDGAFRVGHDHGIVRAGGDEGELARSRLLLAELSPLLGERAIEPLQVFRGHLLDLQELEHFQSLILHAKVIQREPVFQKLRRVCDPRSREHDHQAWVLQEYQ